MTHDPKICPGSTHLVTAKQLRLRRADDCATCHSPLSVGTSAWWDIATRTVTCTRCHNSSTDEAPRDAASKTAVQSATSANSMIDYGEAGRSAHEKYQHLHDQRDRQIDAKFGRFAGLVKFMTDDPQSITAWNKGSTGERELAASLLKNLGDQAIILNDRSVPRTRGNIDHIVIAPSGVWVVDAKNYSGLVQQRDKGGFFKIDMRLYVGGRDRSKVIDGLDWQVRAVKEVLADVDVPVTSAVCFTDAEWKLFAKPIEMRGVFVSGPNALARRIGEPGPLSRDAIQQVAGHLSTALPSKT